ncbi:MAG: gliding motility-associated C-terminal domain-containing protein [Bacteroidota bacterium]
MSIVIKIMQVRVLLFTLLLLITSTVMAQPRNKGSKPKKQPVIVTDSVIKYPSRIELTATGNCIKGTTEVITELRVADSTITPDRVFLYRLPDTLKEIDTTVSDSALFEKSYEYASITANKNMLYGLLPGRYYAKTMTAKQGKMVFSIPSNIVEVSFCSKIEFPPIFDKTVQTLYTPGPFINVQIVEFDIFDRMGGTAYSHKNNDIVWDGNYPNKQPCAAGVYYFHCSYIDLSQNDGAAKSLSGMIELKN